MGWTCDKAEVFARMCEAIFHLSLDGKTTTPQPAIITSNTKALLLPIYFRDVAFKCHVIIKKSSRVSYHHHHHCLIFPLDPPSLDFFGFRNVSHDGVEEWTG